MDYRIFWTNESLANLQDTLDYLNSRWTEKEVNNFKSKLGKLIELIEKQPLIFPVSVHNPNLRKAVLSPQTTVYYRINYQQVEIIYIFNNRKNPKLIR